MKILSTYSFIRLSLFMAIVASTLTSCVKDDLEDSRLCGKGAVVLTADFSRHTADMPLPDTYQAIVAGQQFAVPANTHSLLPYSFEPQPATLLAFNEPEGMERSGMTIQVKRLADGSIEPMPALLFTCKSDILIPKDDTLRVSLPMQQRVFPMRFELPVVSGDASLIESVEGEVSGIAQSFDLERQEVVGGAPAKIHITFYKEESAETRSARADGTDSPTVTYVGKAGLLGIEGNVQILTLRIRYSDGQTQDIEKDINDMVSDIGDGDDLDPLTITGGIEAPMEAGLESAIKDWTVKNEEIEIK